MSSLWFYRRVEYVLFTHFIRIIMICILLYLVTLICFSFASNPLRCVERMWVWLGRDKGANLKKNHKCWRRPWGRYERLLKISDPTKSSVRFPFPLILFNCCQAPAKCLLRCASAFWIFYFEKVHQKMNAQSIVFNIRKVDGPSVGLVRA
jgi:hypothetical protein